MVRYVSSLVLMPISAKGQSRKPIAKQKQSRLRPSTGQTGRANAAHPRLERIRMNRVQAGRDALCFRPTPHPFLLSVCVYSNKTPEAEFAFFQKRTSKLFSKSYHRRQSGHFSLRQPSRPDTLGPLGPCPTPARHPKPQTAMSAHHPISLPTSPIPPRPVAAMRLAFQAAKSSPAARELGALGRKADEKGQEGGKTR